MLHVIHNNIRRLVGRIGRRIVQSRRGSVLILVVVLLVLMAMLGTAFLVTTRTDLAGSRLFEHNVQIDLLVQGVVNMSEAAITNTSYQTVPAPGSPNVLQYYDDWFTTSNAYGPSTAVDHTWLASRFPTYANNPPIGTAVGVLPSSGIPSYPVPKGAVVQVGAGATSSVYVSLVDNNTTTAGTSGSWATFSVSSLVGSNATLTPVWPAVTAPLGASGNYLAHFEDPRSPTIAINPSEYVNATNSWNNVRTFVAPTYLAINTGQGSNTPALAYYSPADGKVETALAASATGNGIADSFLWRLPVGSIDGITYYAAVRIIDDNSAVNVNTANSSTNEWMWNGSGNNPVNSSPDAGYQGFLPGMLPTGIGLGELTYTFNSTSINLVLADNAAAFGELASVNTYRCSGQPRPTGVWGGTGTMWEPVDDSNQQHADFTYRNVGDALWNGLGRRLNNPGYVAQGVQYTPFTWSESAELAYRGDLVNPAATPTVIEQVLAPSLYNHNWTAPAVGNIPTIGFTFRTTPWDPQYTSTWFAGYNIAVAGTANARAYFVARNPVSNLMPAHALTTAVTGLTAADLINLQTYMIGPNANYSSATPMIPKVSLNTADVTMSDSLSSGLPAKTPTLWLGFYNAMLDVLQQQVQAPPGTNVGQLYMTNPTGWGQFRSPIRDINPGAAGTFLNGPQTVLLRSLLAACNAKDLRDSDDDCTAEQVNNFSSTISGGSAAVNVYAYGFEKQPFITEVYANNETQSPTLVGATQKTNTNGVGALNPQGYVLVELFNPYDVPIDMTNWTMGILTRTGAAFPGMQVAPIPGFVGFGNDGVQSAVIPPHSYMILENYPANAGTTAGPSDAHYRPWMAYNSHPAVGTTPATVGGSPVYFITGLGIANAGGELVLLRQRFSKGANGVNVNGLGNPIPPTTLLNLIPADSFDFSGMTVQAANATTFTAIHYIRSSPGSTLPGTYAANDPRMLLTYWKFVYPGRWDAGNPTTGAPPAFQVVHNAQNSLPATFAARQEGIAVSSWNTSPVGGELKGDSWADTNPLGIGNALGTSALPAYGVGLYFGQAPIANIPYTGNTGNANWPYGSSYYNMYPAIQLNNTDMGGPTKQYASPGPPFMFPFGGFARVGDVLQVPFIGSYTILNQTNSAVIEMNPITRDCALAADADNVNYATTPATVLSSGLDDPIEQIGRFCPLLSAQQPVGGSFSDAAVYVAPGTAAAPGYDSYAWASHVMDYFSTIQNPNDDYFPNTDPYTYALSAWNTTNHQYTYNAGTWNAPTGQYQGQAQTAIPVNNSGASAPAANAGYENFVPVDGQINLNTASVQTLSVVPIQPINPGGYQTSGVVFKGAQQANQYMAYNLVTYRNTYGPFKTLFDLNRVLNYSTSAYPGYQAYNPLNGGPINPATTDFGPVQGDISPLATGADGATNDFETRFANITRLSNILTTRSDTFTVYVLVQGWTGVGTSNPQVVVQRRVAFIVDRSKLTPTNQSLGITTVQSY